MLTRWMEVRYGAHLGLQAGRGRAQRRNNALCPHSCLGERRPSSPRPEAGPLSSPVCPWHLWFGAAASALALRARESSVVSPCAGSLKACDSSCTPSHSAVVSAAFHSHRLWGLLFLALALGSPLGWGAWHGARAPRSSRGTSAANTSLLILSRHMCVRGQPFYVSAAPTSLEVASSVCPQLLGFCGAGLQVTPNDDSAVV